MNQYTNPWTKEEIQAIEKDYPSNKDTSNLLLDRTHSAILHKVSKLNIRKRQNSDDVENRITNTKLNSDVAYIVGALLGDGCLIENINQIQLRVTSESFANEVKKRLNKITEIDYKVTKSNVKKRWKDKTYHSTFYNVRCGRKGWFEYFKVLTKKPEILLSKDIVILKSFIKGYIDAEGCANIKGRCISVGNTNKNHINLLEKMLQRLEFKTNRTIGRTTSGKPYYHLNIHGIFFIQKYVKEIGFSEPTKQEKASSMKYKIKRWTEEEISKLREEYPKVGSLVKINRSRDCISHKASELNIRYRG